MMPLSMLHITPKRLDELGLFLAEFALDFLPAGADVKTYNAGDFLAMFDKWFQPFIGYAETNRMFHDGEREALEEHDTDLINAIKDAAVDAARELIMEKI